MIDYGEKSKYVVIDENYILGDIFIRTEPTFVEYMEVILNEENKKTFQVYKFISNGYICTKSWNLDELDESRKISNQINIISSNFMCIERCKPKNYIEPKKLSRFELIFED
jgi:hypothetical protein